MNPDDWAELKIFRTIEQLSSLGMRYRCELQTILKYGNGDHSEVKNEAIGGSSIFVRRVNDLGEKLIARDLETLQEPVEKYWAAYSQLREITKQVKNLLSGIN